MADIKITEVLVNDKRVYNGTNKNQAWVKYGEQDYENHTHTPIKVRGWFRATVAGDAVGNVKFNGDCGGTIAPPHEGSDEVEYVVNDMEEGGVYPFEVSTELYVQRADNEDLLGAEGTATYHNTSLYAGRYGLSVDSGWTKFASGSGGRVYLKNIISQNGAKVKCMVNGEVTDTANVGSGGWQDIQLEAGGDFELYGTKNTVLSDTWMSFEEVTVVKENSITGSIDLRAVHPTEYLTDSVSIPCRAYYDGWFNAQQRIADTSEVSAPPPSPVTVQITFETSPSATIYVDGSKVS